MTEMEPVKAILLPEDRVLLTNQPIYYRAQPRSWWHRLLGMRPKVVAVNVNGVYKIGHGGMLEKP